MNLTGQPITLEMFIPDLNISFDFEGTKYTNPEISMKKEYREIEQKKSDACKVRKV